MPRQTPRTRWIDHQTYEMRGRGHSWAYIAQALDLSGESVARASANRHAQRLGIVTEVNARRSAAGRLAASRRHGRTDAIVPEGRAALVQNTLLPLGQRTFGAEIEFVGKYKHQAARDIALALHEAGVTVPFYMGTPHIHSMPYHGNTCEVCHETLTEKYLHWRLERDGSVTQHRTWGEFGGEVVSPILTTENFQHLNIVLKALRQETDYHNEIFGAKVTRSCGLHIHVGVKDLTPAQRAKVVQQWYGYAEVLHTFVAQDRVGGTYSRQMGVSEVQRVMTLLESDVRDEYAYQRVTEKYRSLNVLPYPKIGTFEFRLHQGTLNFNKVRNWVTLLMAFVEAFATDETAPNTDVNFYNRTATNTVSFLDLLVTKTDATEAVKKFYFKRQNQFAPQVAVTTQRLLGNEQTVTTIDNDNDERSEF